MRTLIALILMLAALWQVKGGGSIDLAEATLAIAGAWFISLFVAE